MSKRSKARQKTSGGDPEPVGGAIDPPCYEDVHGQLMFRVTGNGANPGLVYGQFIGDEQTSDPFDVTSDIDTLAQGENEYAINFALPRAPTSTWKVFVVVNRPDLDEGEGHWSAVNGCT